MCQKSKYQRWYDQIIERARTRTLDIYREQHHIIPRAFDGGDGPDNLVDLTYREHFLAHWLLTKICVGRDRALMAFALHCMSFSSTGRIIAGWQFEIAKRVLKREYLLRFKYRYELRQEVRREKLRQIADAAARVPEKVNGLFLKNKGSKRAVGDLANDLLKGQGALVRRQSRKTQAANIREKLIVAEAKMMGIVIVPNKKKRRRHKTAEQQAQRRAAMSASG